VYESIFRNLPGNPAWVGSFYERLAEDAVWDKEEFWKLHLALIDAATQASGSVGKIDRELAWAVAKIQSRVLCLVASHYDPHDIFIIANLTSDELHQFIERFCNAILGVFSGEILAESSCDLRSPLIGDT
jgi:hypothetical protein